MTPFQIALLAELAAGLLLFALLAGACWRELYWIRTGKADIFWVMVAQLRQRNAKRDRPRKL
jgi:hypothetical protein